LEREDNRILLERARRLLTEHGLFRGIGPREQAELFSRIRVHQFSAGETIFLKGSPGDNMLAVLSGSVRIGVDSPDGRGLVFAVLHSGDVFGEIALLDGKERTADAIAMSASSLAILDRRDVLSFLERYPIAWPYIVSVLCDHLRRTSDQLAEVALLQLPVRLARVLIRLMVQDSPSKPGQYRIDLVQRELGELVGGTRESVNKSLRTWQDQGILVIKKGRIIVTDRTALETLIERA
jgi:CRP-like cAMP-binding protein